MGKLRLSLNGTKQHKSKRSFISTGKKVLDILSKSYIGPNWPLHWYCRMHQNVWLKYWGVKLPVLCRGDWNLSSALVAPVAPWEWIIERAPGGPSQLTAITHETPDLTKRTNLIDVSSWNVLPFDESLKLNVVVDIGSQNQRRDPKHTLVWQYAVSNSLALGVIASDPQEEEDDQNGKASCQ